MTNEELEEKTIKTYDRTAKNWTQVHMLVNDWEETAKRFKQLLSSGRVLEIGCGGVRDATELMKLGFDYVGTDASPGMIEVSKRAIPEGDFRLANVYDLASLDSQFDGFWACAVLLHIPRGRIDEALQAIRSQLKPNAIGMISIKDGDKDDFEVRDTENGHEERLFVYWHKSDFGQVLNSNSFKIIEYTYRPISQRTNWHIFFVQLVDNLNWFVGNKSLDAQFDESLSWLDDVPKNIQ